MPKGVSLNRKTARKKAPALTVQTEDYLERIQELLDRKGYARVSDIADELNLTPSTVSNMVRRLAGQDLIEFENYRGSGTHEQRSSRSASDPSAPRHSH